MVTASCDKPNNFVIFKESVNIGQQLIERGLGKPTPVPKQKPPTPIQTAPPTKPTQAPKATPPAAQKVVKNVTLTTIKPPVQNFEALVTAINSPSDLYIQVFDKEQIKVFQKLTTDMDVHYRNCAPAQQKFVAGDLCVAKDSQECWCRCRVLENNNNGKAKVKLVDFGSEEEVEIVGLQPLLEQFAGVPAMAVHCSLADVFTPGGGNTWNKEATAFLQNKVRCEVSKGKFGGDTFQ